MRVRGLLLIAAAFGFTSASVAHDASRPDLTNWFMGLSSRISPCCDGSEVVHLKNVDWATQDKPNSHFRVRIPANAEAYAKSLKGEQVPTVWVDVPDKAVLSEPNKEGTTLVWPMYPANVPGVRCFMPGPEV